MVLVERAPQEQGRVTQRRQQAADIADHENEEDNRAARGVAATPSRAAAAAPAASMRLRTSSRTADFSQRIPLHTVRWTLKRLSVIACGHHFQVANVSINAA